MSYILTNVSDGQIVCDLATKGKTLRLDMKQSLTVKDSEITPHIENLINKGLMLGEKVSNDETKEVKKKNAVNNSNKKKEE